MGFLIIIMSLAISINIINSITASAKAITMPNKSGFLVFPLFNVPSGTLAKLVIASLMRYFRLEFFI